MQTFGPNSIGCIAAQDSGLLSASRRSGDQLRNDNWVMAAVVVH
jgi:hypothetical protein